MTGTGKPRLLILTGATATGKSAFLYREMAAMPVSVINADSRQVYRKLRISSAGPSDAEMQIFPHYLFHFQREQDLFSAGEYCRLAEDALRETVTQSKIPVLCGGTYFYIQSLLNGLLPPIEISKATEERVSAMSPPQAYALLSELDPVAATKVHANNIHRVQRALSVCLETGRPMSQIERIPGIRDDYQIRMLIFQTPRESLAGRIAARIDAMFAAGLVAEVAGVMEDLAQFGDSAAWRQVPALTGIGVREFFEARESGAGAPPDLSHEALQQIREQIIQNTLGLVKRQLTWFRNAPAKPADTKTVDPAYENERIAALVKEFLS